MSLYEALPAVVLVVALWALWYARYRRKRWYYVHAHYQCPVCDTPKLRLHAGGVTFECENGHLFIYYENP